MFLMFIYLLFGVHGRERAEEGQRETETEKPEQGRLCADRHAQTAGLELTHGPGDRDLSLNQRGGRLTDQATREPQ